jgi:hypothetical protein
MLVGNNDELFGAELYAEITSLASVSIYCNVGHTGGE